jgi:hypothetical protein
MHGYRHCGMENSVWWATHTWKDCWRAAAPVASGEVMVFRTMPDLLNS